MRSVRVAPVCNIILLHAVPGPGHHDGGMGAQNDTHRAPPPAPPPPPRRRTKGHSLEMGPVVTV